MYVYAFYYDLMVSSQAAAAYNAERLIFLRVLFVAIARRRKLIIAAAAECAQKTVLYSPFKEYLFYIIYMYKCTTGVLCIAGGLLY